MQSYTGAFLDDAGAYREVPVIGKQVEKYRIFKESCKAEYKLMLKSDGAIIFEGSVFPDVEFTKPQNYWIGYDRGGSSFTTPCSHPKMKEQRTKCFSNENYVKLTCSVTRGPSSMLCLLRLCK